VSRPRWGRTPTCERPRARPPCAGPSGPRRAATPFALLAARFAERLAAVRPHVGPRYVRDDWAARNAELERDLLPAPPPDFLRHPAILFQMFVDERVLPHELPYVLERDASPALLREDAVGGAPLSRVPGTTLATSSNTVHQLHHLLRYEHESGRRIADAATVVEWGGGFGSLMRLVARMHGGRPTCVILDTPVFSAIQWLYLSAVLGEERVRLHAAAPVQPVPGAVNVVPVGLARALSVDADLFISNWALNESTAAAQAEVVARRWFGAEALLLAMHEGDPLTRVAIDHGARAVPLGDFMPGQRYLIR
jgi:hypothetical protein